MTLCSPAKHALIIFLLKSTQLQAEAYYWPSDYWVPGIKFPSPHIACLASSEQDGNFISYVGVTMKPEENAALCEWYSSDELDINDGLRSTALLRRGGECGKGEYNPLTGQCEMLVDHRCESPTVGNPIEIKTGYKIQKEYDLGQFSE